MTGVTYRQLVKRFGDIRALDGVDLEIRAGELFFLLGPSGCGKTTALRIAAGFEEPDSGEILFGDRCMNNVPPNRRRASMVFQNYALWPHMTVAENVAYGPRVRKLPAAEVDRRVKKTLSMVKMEKYALRKPGELSGGEQQRIALARALAAEPEVILFDEPLSNLDAKLREELRREIREIHGSLGFTAIYVTHDQEEALLLAQRLAVMDAGKISQVGTPRELYEKPAGRFVAEFLGQPNIVKARARAGSSMVQTPFGEIRLGLMPDAEGEIVLCLRPESITLGGGEVSFDANVLQVNFLGAREEILIEGPGGARLRIWRLYTPEALRPGDPVRAGFRASDLWALKG